MHSHDNVINHQLTSQHYNNEIVVFFVKSYIINHQPSHTLL